jgi:hypothetical protein
LRKYSALQIRLSDLPGVEDVVTPLNAQIIRGDEFGLEISPVAYGTPETEEEIEEFRNGAEGQSSGIRHGI